MDSHAHPSPGRELAHELRQAGLRVTASRVAVLQLLRHSKRPMTHADVVSAFADQSWDRATLYRNLTDLVEVSLLRRIALGSTWHYEAVATRNASAMAHPHFVCDECGAVECTPEIEMQLKGFGHRSQALQRGEIEVQLHGRCDNCQ